MSHSITIDPSQRAFALHKGVSPSADPVFKVPSGRADYSSEPTPGSWSWSFNCSRSPFHQQTIRLDLWLSLGFCRWLIVLLVSDRIRIPKNAASQLSPPRRGHLWTRCQGMRVQFRLHFVVWGDDSLYSPSLRGYLSCCLSSYATLGEAGDIQGLFHIAAKVGMFSSLFCRPPLRRERVTVD